MTTTTQAIPRLTHDDAGRLATHAYDRMLELLDDLAPSDWSRPTDCEGWDVAAIVGHLIGAAKGHASLREMLRQVRHGARNRAAFGGNDMDAMNDLQVRDHAHLSPAERVTALRAVAPDAVRRRVGLPAPFGRIPVPLSTGTGSMASDLPARVSLRYLNDVVLTRDVLLHRIDIARATDRDPRLGGADRDIVADAVADWADAHGRPFVLELEGPAGGRWQRGQGGPHLRSDVVGFCRAVTGRCEADGLLATSVLF